MKELITVFLTLLVTSSTLAFSIPSESKMVLEDEKNTVGIFKSAVHSVVNVSNLKKVRTSLFDFSGTEVPAGTGSGFIWDDKGHIVTNYHVIHGGTKFLISFHKDDQQYPANLVGVAPQQDIAVLKLTKLPKNLVPVKKGQSDHLVVGQKAIAIGNPFGLDHTVTTGIISALERKIDGVGGVKIHGIIQTDASINPGNSGGPLLNSSGELIGINTMIYSNSGSSSGIGFSVPSKLINRTVPDIITHGVVVRPSIGASIIEGRTRTGIILKTVFKEGPAAKAGLKGIMLDKRGRRYLGDIILSINEEEIKNYDDIYHVLGKYKIGETVKVKYLREGKESITDIKLQASNEINK